MESQLRELVGQKEYYSAHQLLISHSQRLERAGKLDSSRQFLLKGINLLNESQAPVATLFDVISKYMIISQKEAQSHPTEQELLQVLSMVVMQKDVPEAHGSFWIEVAGFAIEKCNPSALICTLLQGEHIHKDQLLNFSLNFLSTSPDVFSTLSSHLDTSAFLWCALNLLARKCFASTNAMCLNRRLDDSKIDAQFFRETSEDAKVYNLIMFLLNLLTRQNAPRDLFVQLQLRYSAQINQQGPFDIKIAWNKLKETYWPSVTQPTSPMNPLANLFQSMMMQR